MINLIVKACRAGNKAFHCRQGDFILGTISMEKWKWLISIFRRQINGRSTAVMQPVCCSQWARSSWSSRSGAYDSRGYNIVVGDTLLGMYVMFVDSVATREISEKLCTSTPFDFHQSTCYKMPTLLFPFDLIFKRFSWLSILTNGHPDTQNLTWYYRTFTLMPIPKWALKERSYPTLK